MNERGKSDGLVVPAKQANEESGAPVSEESVEGSGPAKGNALELVSDRSLGRGSLQYGLERVRQAAKKKGERLTSLWHHVYNVHRLRESFYALERESAPGVDGVTWASYRENLEENLEDLSVRVRRGSYKTRPVLRRYVPKGDGGRRPIGIPTLEDKIVQRSFAEVVGTIFETEFVGFSYGYRLKRSAHNALDALSVGLEKRKVNWVLDADIRGFFDAISREWLVEFIEHRIADKRVVRFVKKWLRAGVLESGKKTVGKSGTPQGGSVSPLLANIYLHYVFDLWAQQWRRQKGRGDVIIVRYADDIVVGFERRCEAEQFLSDLRERFRRFDLELHPEKTRLIEFGRFAAKNRNRRGQGKPETFDFLGFTHACSTDRRGRFIVRRRTMRKRMGAKLRQVKYELQRRFHDPVPETGRWLGLVLQGHYRYYGVPRNIECLKSFRQAVLLLWWRRLDRRSQKGRIGKERIRRLAQRWLPRARITHPYPNRRLRVST